MKHRQSLRIRGFQAEMAEYISGRVGSGGQIKKYLKLKFWRCGQLLVWTRPRIAVLKHFGLSHLAK